MACWRLQARVATDGTVQCVRYARACNPKPRRGPAAVLGEVSTRADSVNWCARNEPDTAWHKREGVVRLNGE